MPTLDQIVKVLRNEDPQYTEDGLRLGWKAVHPDLRTSYDFRWPFPGQWAEADTGGAPFTSGDPCPQFRGDGLCIALTWAGAASGGIPARTGLLLAYDESAVLGRDPDKVRVRRALVLDVLDLPRLIRNGHLSGANLSGAYLSGATLSGADLTGAYLGGATLSGANLSRATLSGAYLGGATLSGADLTGAYLGGATLSGADLTGANLGGATLSGADLTGANLSGANLSRADLSGANLSRATLSRADLSGANLSGAYLTGAYLTGADLTNAIGYQP